MCFELLAKRVKMTDLFSLKFRFYAWLIFIQRSHYE